MPPPAHDLTPAEIAALIGPDNHPDPLSADELDRLTAPLTDQQLEEVLNLVGLGTLARQLPPALLKLMRIAKHIASARPPEYDDEVDAVTRNFDLVGFASALGIDAEPATPPPSSPAPPQTPVRPRPAQSAPSTPHTAVAGRSYVVDSPAKVGRAIPWLEAGALTQGVRGASVHATGKRQRSRKKSHAYVVFYGGTIDVFDSWDKVQPAITGHGVAIHCGFPSTDAAHAALAYARRKGWTGDSSPPPDSPSPSTTYTENPLNVGSDGLWYVVCRGVQPGIYRSHLECSLNVTGVKRNLFSAFDTFEEAESAFAGVVKAKLVQKIPRAQPLKRERLKSAPSAVQLEYSVRAALYRKNYLQRTKRAVQKPLPKLTPKKSPPHKPPRPESLPRQEVSYQAQSSSSKRPLPPNVKGTPSPPPVPRPTVSKHFTVPPTFRRSESGIIGCHNGMFIFAPPSPPPHPHFDDLLRARTPDSPTPLPRKAAPLSLAEIDAGDSDDSYSEGGWDGDNESEPNI
ncbi:hypothetical protein C8R47DRAFT_1210450 [Mycena vitilis]|nr:hypothetical protein C8R47DRAFT_1210450 [Mycena vitilis]